MNQSIFFIPGLKNRADAAKCTFYFTWVFLHLGEPLLQLLPQTVIGADALLQMLPQSPDLLEVLPQQV